MQTSPLFGFFHGISDWFSGGKLDGEGKEHREVGKQKFTKLASLLKGLSSLRPKSRKASSGTGAERASPGASVQPRNGENDMNTEAHAVKYIALEFPKGSNTSALLNKLTGLYRKSRRGYHLGIPEPTTVVIEDTELDWWKGKIAEAKYPGSYKTVSVTLAGNLPPAEAAALRRRRSPPLAHELSTKEARQVTIGKLDKKLAEYAKIRKERNLKKTP